MPVLARMLARAADGPDFRTSRNGRGRAAAAAHGLRERGRAMARRRGQVTDLGLSDLSDCGTQVGAKWWAPPICEHPGRFATDPVTAGVDCNRRDGWWWRRRSCSHCARFRVYLHMLDFLLMQRHAEVRLPRTRERSCLELDTAQAAAARSVIRRRCPSRACSAEILPAVSQAATLVKTSPPSSAPSPLPLMNEGNTARTRSIQRTHAAVTFGSGGQHFRRFPDTNPTKPASLGQLEGH